MSETPRPRLLTCPRCKESYLGGPHEQYPIALTVGMTIGAGKASGSIFSF